MSKIQSLKESLIENDLEFKENNYDLLMFFNNDDNKNLELKQQ